MKNPKQSDQPQENEGGKVHFLSPLKDIPDPNVPLLATGRRVYDEWCRTLIRSGLLTLKTREYVEMLALATDDIAYAIEKNKRPTRQAIEAKRAAMMKLERLDVAGAIVSPAGGESIYAKFGFAKRAKQARFAGN
jgi:hypothetical protein